MALGKRRSHREQSLFVPLTAMPQSPGHPFYRRLNDLLAEADFDKETEAMCEKHYASNSGRPSIPPGVYFRMLLIGYFEGIGSQRGIAWRCADSRSLQEFLGLGPTERTPDHSSLTRIRNRLPLEAHQEVFDLVLGIVKQRGLLKGKALGVDSTSLEANAAMKSIVRKGSGKGWKQYLRGLAEEEGIDDPDDDDIRRFDRKRSDKKVSNKDWESPTDPDARIGRMKDGRTRLSYKAQHTIDLETEVVIAATVHHGDVSDAELLKDALVEVAGALAAVGHDDPVTDVVADKGYHKAATLAWAADRDVKTHIPERRSSRNRRWKGKPDGQQAAFRANRRRVSGPRSRALQRKRSERVERSFAHTCTTGGLRRTHLRGLEANNKRYLVHAAARNLGLVMRKLFGAGTPRGLSALLAPLMALLHLVRRYRHLRVRLARALRRSSLRALEITAESLRVPATAPSSTGC